MLRETGGAVSALTALMTIPLLGMLGLVVDVGYWYYKHRDMQNAADSAAIAAAQTPDEDLAFDGTNDDFINVAQGTTSRYGYVEGEDGVTVRAARVPCPADATETCTQVQIGYISPLYFTPIVGFSGDAGGGGGQTVWATAIAGDSVGAGTSTELCILALDTTPGVDGIGGNGVPNADLNGCDIFSNNDMTCNGHDMGAGTGIAVGDSVGCGDSQVSGAEPFEDPYRDYADNIPEDPCGGNYPQATVSGTNNIPGASDSSGQYALGLSGNQTGIPGWSGEQIRCGDVVLTGDATLDGVTLVIFNGRLVANANTLAATNSTIVFAGDNNSSYHHYLTDTTKNGSNLNNSGFDISSPTSGDWSGVAVYTDPDLTTNVDLEQAGNEPVLDISGLLYTPNSDSLISGIVDKAGGGHNCFVWVTSTLLINGTAQIFADPTSECDDQGLDVPTIGTTGRPWLVF